MKDIFEPLEHLIIEDEPNYDYSRPFVMPDPHYPALVLNGDRIQIWCEFDEDFGLEILSPYPHSHSVWFEVDAMGATDLLDPSGHSDDDLIALAIQTGVTYRQPFLLEVYVHYSKGCDGEIDTEKEWSVLHITPLSPQETIDRFQEWIDRGYVGQP